MYFIFILVEIKVKDLPHGLQSGVLRGIMSIVQLSVSNHFLVLAHLHFPGKDGCCF